MKLTDKIVGKFGADKVMHFSLGGMIAANIICAYSISISQFNFLVWMVSTLVSLFALFMVSVVKDLMDSVFDWKDVEAAMIGGGVSSLFALFVLLFKIIF